MFGDSVNVASRMVGLAKRGQVILSHADRGPAVAGAAGRVRELDVLTVKGKEQDIGICELLWQDSSADLTAMAPRSAARAARLELRHGARTFELDANSPAVTLGRDAQNDVVIGDPLASRLHARIERRRDKFVLVDQSSNGTFVTVDGEPEIHAAARGDDPAPPRQHQLRPPPRSRSRAKRWPSPASTPSPEARREGRAAAAVEPARSEGARLQIVVSLRSTSGFFTTVFCRPGDEPYSPAGGLVSSARQHRRRRRSGRRN